MFHATDHYALRQNLALKILTRNDWALTREMTIKAAQEPWTSTLPVEKRVNRPELIWRGISHSDFYAQSFVLYKADKPIGFTTIVNEFPEALFQSSYLEPEMRGLHYSQYLYRARFKQAKEWDVQQVRLLCRDSNHRSRRVARQWGFRSSRTEKQKPFADGTTGNIDHFRVNLAQIAPVLHQLDRIDPIPILTNQ